MTDDGVRSEAVVLFITQVSGATRACAEHGDAAAYETSQSGHACFVEAARAAGGTVVKALGDGLLISFPPERAREAVAAMRAAREAADLRWKALDERCEVQVKGSFGAVMIGLVLGRHDLYGNTLNRLFKEPASAFSLSESLEALTR